MQESAFNFYEFKRVALPCEDEIMEGWAAGYQHPAVSVICTTYNHACYIEDALRGFLLQKTNFPFEILVHDDASTDATASILKAYQRKYPRIIRLILQKENQYSKGMGFLMLRHVFPHARGEYLATCEGDDYWIDSDKLTSQKEALDREARFSACSCYSITQGADVVASAKRQQGPGRDRIITLLGFSFGKKGNSRTCTLFYRKEIFDSVDVNALPSFYAGDNIVRLLLLKRGPILVLGKAMVVYRLHPGGIWSALSNRDALQRKESDLFSTLRIAPYSTYPGLFYQLFRCYAKARRMK
jgi:glycosyltransferase involved in cell wall biosynthesis